MKPLGALEPMQFSNSQDVLMWQDVATIPNSSTVVFIALCASRCGSNLIYLSMP